MDKKLYVLLSLISALAVPTLFGMDFPEETIEFAQEAAQKKEKLLDNAYATSLNNNQERPLVLQGCTSLKFQAAQKVTTKLDLPEITEYVNLLQKHKGWFSNKIDYESCLKEAVQKPECGLVQQLMIASHFLEWEDHNRRRVILYAARARNFPVLRNLMTVDKEAVESMLYWTDLVNISIPWYYGTDKGYRKTLWDDSNRDIAEMIFEKKLVNFAPAHSGKKRADYAQNIFVSGGGGSFLRCHYDALMIAAHIGSLKYVQEFIKQIDVNQKTHFGISALYEAARSKNGEVIQFLIENGADSIWRIFECFLDDTQVTKLLYQGLERGCATQEDYATKQVGPGKTLLFYAAMANLQDEIKLLIQCGANVNRKDNLGKTPLFYAIIKNSKDAVKLLIDAGADVNSVANDYRVPLSVCRDASIRKLLVDNGARDNMSIKLKSVAYDIKQSGFGPWIDGAFLIAMTYGAYKIWNALP